jgi:hypothetical protein
MQGWCQEVAFVNPLAGCIASELHEYPTQTQHTHATTALTMPPNYRGLEQNLLGYKNSAQRINGMQCMTTGASISDVIHRLRHRHFVESIQ